MDLNLRNEVEECCIHLGSTKITERKKFCEKLKNLLDNEDECLRKDGEKIAEDIKKKGSVTVKYPSAELFIQIIKTATKEAEDELNFSNLVGYIIGCMKDSRMRICYESTFLVVLKEYILVNPKCRGNLKNEDWMALFTFFKKLCEEKFSEPLILKCFMLIVKWGPSSGVSSNVLRESFEFITKICQMISQTSPSNQQEDVLDIVLDFCRHTAKDNRISCCKLGEDIFSNLIDLYELNGCEAKIKRQLIEFYLLQVVIHQPGGIIESHPCAYAVNWNTWKKCLRRIYLLLNEEISFYFTYQYKNSSFFIRKGKSITLWDNFSKLFVEVARQLFVCPNFDITTTLDCSLISQGAQKRRKLDISLKSYINNIQETKSWLWIHIVSAIIKTYPELVDDDVYLSLLQILSTLQIESNVYDVVHNIYSCFMVMLDIQDKISSNNGQSEITKVWKIIGETTLRAFGLNQHKQVTETLLQALIPKKLVDLESVLQTYTSGVLIVSVQSIKTMDAALHNLNHTQLERTMKETLINCILNSQNTKDYDYLLDPRTAKFLVNLTLQQWPLNESGNCEEPKEVDKQCDLKDLYFQTLLEKTVLPSKVITKKEPSELVYNLDPDAAKMLSNILKDFVNSTSSEVVEWLLSVVVLLTNITSYLIKYKLLDEMEVDNCASIKLIEKILNYGVIRRFQLYENKNDREAQKLMECISVLDKIFTFNDGTFLVSKVKDLIPFEILRSLVGTLNDLQEESINTSHLKFELKKSIIGTLSNFSCISNADLNRNQQHVLEVVAAPSYSCKFDGDCILLLTFLNTFKYSKPGIIMESVLENVLKSVQEICYERYQCSEDAIKILDVLYILYPHLALVNSAEIKSTSVEILNPFYEQRDNYGPEVSVAVLNCVERLCELDPEGNFSRWGDTEIIRYVPEFLCSDYQEVRFKAIEVLAIFFHVMSKSKRLQDFHMQEEIFSKMYEKCLAVFELTGELTQERRTDEIITRTASVLHTFTSIILYCNSWIEECLFSLVKLTYRKNLGSVDKVLEIINEHFCGKCETNCIEKYLEDILEKWLNEDYNIDVFPFKLFKCETKAEFYLKYFDICVPLFIIAERKDLIAVAQRLDLNEKDLVNRTCPKIFGRALCNDIENMIDIVKRDNVLTYYTHVVGVDGLKQCLIDNIDQLLSYILGSLTDEKYIYEIFGENVIFCSKNLSSQQFRTCVSFIESFLCEDTNIISFFCENRINKLEKILMQLKSDIYNVFTTDDKMKYFHRYATWLNVVLDYLNSNGNIQHFFIKDTTYTLINLIENHRTDSKIVSGICNFLFLFLKKVLPEHSETFENILTFTVNSLKKFATQLTPITDVCLEILYFLIVQNSCQLMSSIEKLDNFPQEPKFDNIRAVHTRIKYGNKEASLEDEIDFFLQHEDLDDRQDSLAHLRYVLSKEKIQLGQLFTKLQDIRGFSEDCMKSPLHRLICMLTKMSCSSNENVRLEAMKCLGEIGPADLLTLVLQHDTGMSDIKCTPFELLSGRVLSMLCEFIVNSDNNLVKAASETLYVVLDSKEGRKMAESNISFGNTLVDKKYLVPYFSPNKSSASSSPTVLIEVFKSKINKNNLWSPSENLSHENWIVLLVTSFLESFSNKSYLPKLVPLCKISTKFCESLLPLLVNLLLFINNKNTNDVLSNKINLFFETHWNLTVPKRVECSLINVNKKSVKCMLDVLNFVRLQRSSKSNIRQVAELDLNYLKVAKAAEFCAAHFSALLYSELWCHAKIQEIEGRKKYNVGLTKLDVIYENEEEQIGEALQDILRNAYRAVGDLDALPGCGNSFLLKPQYRVQHYKELDNWEQVTHFYEMQVSHGVDSARRDLMESLKKCGLYQLPLLCNKQSDESQYECLWRLGQWSTDEKRVVQSDVPLNPTDYEKYRFYSLKALHDRNEYAFDIAKKAQSLCMVEHLRHTSLESSQNMYPVLTQLQALNEMGDFAETVTSKNFASLLTKWKLQDDLVRKNDFQYVEPVIAQRIVMLSEHLKMNSDDELKNYLIKTLLDFTDFAREEGHFRVSARALDNLRYLSDLSSDIQTKIQLADAQLSWSLNDKMVARNILNRLYKNMDINPKLRSAALNLLGSYMSETFSENRFTVINNYFLKSLTVFQDIEKTQEDYNSILDTYDKIAQFADKGYQQIMTYMKSDLFEKKIVNMEKAKETALNIQKQAQKTQDEYQAVNIHVKQSKIDEIEIKNTKLERNQFLKLALKYQLQKSSRRIHSFGMEYHPVGGINLPKRITCRGTDGKVKSQLLKGRDDLRQDAVMQQVFGIMNNLLSGNKQTRHLLIRTYKIVPLSMRSGILEWVDNSMPIGDYLVGKDKKPGAHQIYRPKDKLPSICREMIQRGVDKTANEKLQIFLSICKDFKPVFHKFFETTFPHPTVWYERKRAYIHSVATTSMCGYILGIGDRHVSNIMIDETTAEVIHIDFGLTPEHYLKLHYSITTVTLPLATVDANCATAALCAILDKDSDTDSIAFEQGRVLRTPETVPFRLTRDIVDGMGVSGVEGLFRRSCEKTMEVLRQNAQTIITTLEVLLYDPLYVWTVTATEANKRQTDDENDLGNLSTIESDEDMTVNITAERALLRLREKLQGTELGNPTSIEHQVGTLIQQAMDPANLCKLFCGWQAYL
ncbi:hypothetical protein NQ318_009470 [Aromia moschata]|uniref:non-specific serine/threonine protein kinase n=1 Tax=Aromia moschata TaxID=1265417 RepID=A0AAV8Z6Z3_9CUCU|nr:hypothetical protein NQ318_009470 [Aromia moschata]